jgi:cob(I)alamin adenosyltransferase
MTPPLVERLEREIDAFEADLAPLTRFILPGGTPPAAALHAARTVCRRAERLVVHLGRQPGEYVAPIVVPYLNRLSDLLFVLARHANHAAGVADTPWDGP